MKTNFIALWVVIFIMKNEFLAQEPYRVLSVQELNKIEEEKEVQGFYQLDFNLATVTKFKDGTASIFPGNGSGEGLFFYNLDTMHRMIAERIFPVKGDGSFWERERERVLRFQENMPYYCAIVSSFLGFEAQMTTEREYLKRLTKAINSKLYNHKLKEEMFLHLAIYIGELIRIHTKARWVLLPQYTLNVYYTPELVAGKKYHDPIWYVIHQLERAFYMPIDIEMEIKQASFVPYGNRYYHQIK